MSGLSSLVDDLAHRALILLVQERLSDDFERRAAEDLSTADLSTMLRDFMREEFIAIPANTPVVRCRWCNAPIYWVQSNDARAHVGGRRLNVSVSVAGGECQRPTRTERGEGFSHLVDCPRSGLLTISNEAGAQC